MGDLRRNDLTLLFSLAAIPMAGCPHGVEDGGGTVFSPTTVASSATASAGDSEDDSGGDSEGTGGNSSASGPSGTTITTAADTGGDPTNAMTNATNASVTNASMTYGGTYGGTYGATYGSSYGGSYGGTYGGDVPPVCEQFASHYVDCVPAAAGDEGEIAYYCASDLMHGAMVGGECGSALDEYWACMSTVDCQELTDPMGDPCYGSELASVCGG
jgi:hypothetical protein